MEEPTTADREDPGVPAVLVVGLDPALVAGVRSSRETFPDMDADTIRAGVAQSHAALRGMGLDVDVRHLDYGATAEAVLRETLAARRYRVVAVGAGVRLDPALTHLLEMCVDVTRELAPQATIVFNTGPSTTAEAVARWFPEPTPLT